MRRSGRDPGAVAEPYVGPRPFARADAGLFFGRDAEAADLASLVLAHRALVLYAPSGAGKSSLLAAKVLPMLGEPLRGALVLGPARVSGEAPEEAANVFAFHVLVSLGVAPKEAARGALADRVEGLARAHALSTDRPVVLVLDQFEELFTRHPDRWRDRGPFFEMLGEASDRLPALRILLSMREEHLGQLVPHARALPEGLRGRYRLERLRRDAALEAVVGPLAGFGRGFAAGAAERLVDNLLRVPVQVGEETREVEGEFVEPVQLQVVCQRLWRALPGDERQIDARDVETRGGVDEALGGYYDECLAGIARETRESEGRLRRWIEDALVTSEGTRGLAHRGASETAGLPNETVDLLEERHLLRAEVRGGGTFYELAHDRFLAPVRASNRRYRSRQMLGRPELVEAEERAGAWVAAGRPAPAISLRRGLLDSKAVLRERDELEEVLRSSSRAAEEGLRCSPELAEYLEVHREAYRAVGKRTLGAILLIVWMLACSLAVAFVYAQDKRAEAVDARSEAERTLEVERGRLAAEFASQPGRQLDALELGLRAIAPALEAGRAPAPEAESALRAAVASVVRRVPLWSSSTVTRSATIGAAGDIAVASDGRHILGFDATDGRPLFAWPVPAELEEKGLMVSNTGRTWVTLGTGRSRDRNRPSQTEPQGASTISELVWDPDGSVSMQPRILIGPNETALAVDLENLRIYTQVLAGLRIAPMDGRHADLFIDMYSPDQVTVSPDGTRCLVQGVFPARLIDPRDGSLIAEISGRWEAQAFSAPGRGLLAFLAEDSDGRALGRVLIHSAESGEFLMASPPFEVPSIEGPISSTWALYIDWFGFLAGDEEIWVVGRDVSGGAIDSVVVRVDVQTANVQGNYRHPGATLFSARRPERILIASPEDGAQSASEPIDAPLVPFEFSETRRIQEIEVDTRVNAIVIEYSDGWPELLWPSHNADVPEDFDDVIDLACERLRGRPEYAELLEEIDRLRR